jgi:hypothetical protein
MVKEKKLLAKLAKMELFSWFHGYLRPCQLGTILGGGM